VLLYCDVVVSAVHPRSSVLRDSFGSPPEDQGGAQFDGGQHTRVVELSSLANSKTTASNDEYLFDIDMFPGFYDAAVQVRIRIWGRLGDTASTSSRGGKETFLGQL